MNQSNQTPVLRVADVLHVKMAVLSLDIILYGLNLPPPRIVHISLKKLQ